MFERYQSVEFQRLPPPAVTFQAPATNSYRSQLADAWDFRCGVNQVPACKAFIRYDAYFIEFYFDIDAGTNEGLRQEQAVAILQALDRHIATVFVLPLPSTSVP